MAFIYCDKKRSPANGGNVSVSENNSETIADLLLSKGGES